MKLAKLAAFAGSIACVGCLTGCSTLDRIIGADNWKDWTPTSTSIQVHQDDSLTETIFDQLDQSWYAGNELQDMIARSMNEYNAEHGEGAVSVTAYSDNGGNVKVVINYRSGEDFAAYNNAVFCSGSMLDAQMQGFLFSGPFYAVEGATLKDGGIEASQPLSHKEYSVVISDGSHVVQVPGEIRYVSGGTQIINSHTAQKAPDSESAEDVQAKDSAQGAEGAQQAQDASLYIIYEKDQELGSVDQ